MRILLLLLAAVFTLSPATAQRIYRNQFDSMQRVLNPEKKDTQQIYTWLRMAEFHIRKPGEFKTDLDSARDGIDKARSINTSVRSRAADGYIILVESLLDKERPEGVAAGEQANRKAVNILLTAQNPLLLGKAWLALSFYGDYRDSATSAHKIDYLEKALACFNEAGQALLQGDCLTSLAELYFGTNSKKAEEAGLLAVQRYKQIGYPELQESYILVTQAFIVESDYTNALKYGLLALDAIKATDDSTEQYCQVNNILGYLFYSLRQYPEAAAYLEASYYWAVRHNDTTNLFVVQANLVGAYFEVNHYSKAIAMVEGALKTYGIPRDPVAAISAYQNLVCAYTAAKQFDKAKLWCERMMAAPKPDANARLLAANAAIRFYTNTRQFEKARALVPEMRAAAADLGEYTVSTISLYRAMFELDSMTHRYAEAIDDHNRLDRVRDSLSEAAKKHEINRLQVDYATSEKEHNILLLQKETEVQKNDIARSNQSRNYSIAGAVLLLGVGFGRYRLKQRQNIQLEAKQKEITGKNEQLEKLLHENEWLLREVHHRVKNNLQIITSLLNSQSAFLTDPRAKNAVVESTSRVHAMSLIHQKLYRNDNISSIDMQDYIGDLVHYLRDIAQTGKPIDWDVQIEKINLDVTQAIPIGLILNEVITNSMKYAFAHTGHPLIRVWLRPVSGTSMELLAADNGAGMPEDPGSVSGNSFGLVLIQGLADDLDAKLNIVNNAGLEYTLCFPISPVGGIRSI